MANQQHIELLKQGTKVWNAWRKKHPHIRPDLSTAPMSEFEQNIATLVAAVLNEAMPGQAPPDDDGFSGLDLAAVDLHRCELRGVNFSRANLMLADLREADLRRATLAGAILTSANLTKCDLRNATLNAAVLRFARLEGARLDHSILRLCNLDGVRATRASLRDADLSFASLNEARLTRADLTGSFVYGSSAWNVDLENAKQANLRITRTSEGTITVDDLKVAQFIHTLLNNDNVREVIDTVTTKLVLILGRFTRERKVVLDEIKRWLHEHDYVPVLFDFEGPASRDVTETVVTLAHLARFIVADVTDPASIAKELEAIVPRLAVPVQPIVHKDAKVYAMFSDYWKYDWVLEIWRYTSLAQLRRGLLSHVVRPSERKATELLARRATARRDSQTRTPVVGRRASRGGKD